MTEHRPSASNLGLPRQGAVPTDVGAELLRAEPRLATLIQLAQERLGALEVWIFGSRARGDHRDDSDWDVMLLFADDAPGSVFGPVALWQIGRDAGLAADVVANAVSDLYAFGEVPTTIEYEVVRDGVRLA